MSAWRDMRTAIEAARETQRVADEAANDLADILSGRLRHVRGYRLATLKKQLTGFNAVTRTWKD